MGSPNRRIYLANFWSEIITKRGFQLLKQKGFEIGGNWIDGSLPRSNNIIILGLSKTEQDLLEKLKEFPKKSIFPYLMYPDQLVGWDNHKKSYKLESNKKFRYFLTDWPNIILSHSEFTVNMVKKTYPDINKVKTIYFPISSQEKKIEKQRIRVLWNHMWRSDKGVVKAFNLVDYLSNKYKDVEFYIGRKNRWGDKKDSRKVKEQLSSVIKDLENRSNVKFFKTIKDHQEYLKFLNKFDIGFSCSYHEGFGLSMLEQAAAGVACVVPKREVYPEVIPGALLVKDEFIGESIERLIQNSSLRNRISQSCRKSASKFKPDKWVNKLTEVIS
jgi:glycosyltransferase involved in cell wall biosynthesis